LTIKKYNTFCNNFRKQKKKSIKKKNLYKEYTRLKSLKLPFLAGLVVIVIITVIGMQYFFDIPFKIVGLEEDKGLTHNLKSEGVIISSIETDDISENGLLEEKDTLELNEVKNELEQLALRDEEVSQSELKLKYQREQSEEEINIISGQLDSGETLYQFLVENSISPAQILNLQEKMQPVVDISRLNVGTKFSVHCNPDGEIVQFDYQPNQLDVYHIQIPQNDMEDIDIKVNKDEIFREVVCFEGEVETSLYEAMVEHCNSGQLAVQLAEIFAWDIDFLTECQPGDTFRILVEKLYRGDFYRWGDILAAVYEGEMLSTHTAILFEDPDGNNEYYDKDGRCLRKAFLKAPLNYKYISSNYTNSRYHPILRIWRPHLAIDYAAPTGTPVVSIGSGTVISRYYDQGGYGNYVKIRHPNGYVTGYGHLSKFASGLKVGQRVEQGEVIGYVGATGLATGPHLDFSISKDGQRIDFLEIDLPTASSVAADYRQDFEMVKKNYLSILQENL